MTTPALHSTPTTHLLSRLIAAPDLDRIVRALPSERFTALVREIGVDDAGELVALATTEQLVAAFDEDLFVNARPGEREVFDRHRFITWLEVLLEAGDRVVARRMAELSEDFVAHALSSIALVFDHDRLRERITQDDPAAEDADAALERALNEEIDGYLLVARQEEGWDAILALVLALDRSDRALLVRLLDRCVALASEHADDLEALTEVLTAAESLAEDVEAAREQRRSELGFVEPRAAKSFLTLARAPMTGDPERSARDAISRAYFRELGRAHSRERVSPPRPADDRIERALAQLPSAAATCSLDDAPRLTLALRDLAEAPAPHFAERLAELGYLANVLLAGLATDDGLRLRPADAAQAALATVSLGAELEARARRGAPDPSRRASAAELRDVLATVPADLLFRTACSTLVGRGWRGNAAGVVRTRAEAESALAELDAARIDDRPARSLAARFDVTTMRLD